MIRFRLAELIADKAFRERRVVSLSEVAEATGIHRATLSKVANQPGANVGTDIIDKLNGADFEAAGRVSGSGFYYLLGDIARLHEAARRQGTVRGG